jgi:membrane-associated phospholipid phosphatase
VLFVVWAVVTDVSGAPQPIPFIERDPALSFPMLRQTVSTANAVGLAVGIPVGLFIVAVVLYTRWHSLPWSAGALAFLWLCIALAQAHVLSNALTNTIKFWLSRQRPNFFALCNYQGYRDSVESGNFTAYDAATAPGRLGSAALCSADKADVWDAQRSFPSGHASTSFCGMTFAALFLRAALRVRAGEHMSLLHAVAASPLFIALWIGITRVRDRWHHEDDVAVGAFIGAACAVFAWKHFQTHQRDGELFSPARGSDSGDGSDGSTRALTGATASGRGSALLAPSDTGGGARKVSEAP